MHFKKHFHLQTRARGGGNAETLLGGAGKARGPPDLVFFLLSLPLTETEEGAGEGAVGDGPACPG